MKATRVRYLVPDGSPPGTQVVLSPGGTYAIEPGKHGVWTLFNDHGSPIGFLNVVDLPRPCLEPGA